MLCRLCMLCILCMLMGLCCILYAAVYVVCCMLNVNVF